MPELEIKDVMQAVGELRSTVEKLEQGKLPLPEFKAKQEVIEKALKNFDKISQETTLTLAKETKAREDAEERIKSVEAEMAKGTKGAQGSYKDAAEYKALSRYVQFGDNELSGDECKLLREVKTLRTDIATGAGYLTTPEYDPEIIKKITEISPMRSISRVKSIGKKTIETPTRTSIPTAAYEGEAEQGVTDQSGYGNETLTAHRISVTIPYTMDMLNAANFDLEREIMGDVEESMGQREGNRYILGTGVKQPEGVASNTTLQAASRETAGSGVIAGDDLLLLTGDLKVGYNPVYIFNRSTLATLRTLKADGRYIWQVGMGVGHNIAGRAPNTISGEPYVVMQDMPSISAGNYPVGYGDFRKGYRIVDWIGMSIIRDEVTQKKNAIIELTFHRWNTGQVVLTEAIKLLKIKA